jgi:hypothetical protein
MISVGMLYDAQKLMRTVSSLQVTTSELLESFKRLEVAELPAVLRLAQQCQWIELDSADTIILSLHGRRIHDMGDVGNQLRHQLRDILHFIQPSWAKKLADGRSEAIKIMPEMVRQIFSEAGLLEEWTDELMVWWDDIALTARTKKNEKKLRTGRIAERLSLTYEEDRTGQKPKWTCAETNYAGYDILSVVSAIERRPCAIEVKGSTQRLKEAHFFLSRNEWGAAEGSPDYRIHLWLIRTSGQEIERDLRVVTSDTLRQHIPIDKGDGKWNAVAIPFAPFWQ